MNKILVLGLICLLVCSIIGFYGYQKTGIDIEEELYQGPVKQGYNIEHFRKTGETIKEVDYNGDS